MAIKFEKIEVGMTLYDRHKYKMGNTTLSAIGEWPVKIISLDMEARTALASWNGNPARTLSDRYLCRLHTWSMYDDNVDVTKGMLGQVTRVRKLTKKEIAERDSEEKCEKPKSRKTTS